MITSLLLFLFGDDAWRLLFVSLCLNKCGSINRSRHKVRAGCEMDLGVCVPPHVLNVKDCNSIQIVP